MKAIISPNIRVRAKLDVADDAIVDDFCYFSANVIVGRGSHIANGCSVGGGKDRTFMMGEFSSLSAGVKIWCASDDFKHDIVCIIPQGCEDVKEYFVAADVAMGDYTAVGSNSVVMPGVHIPSGTVIGALSYVRPYEHLEPWSVYAGNPLRIVGRRDRARVQEQAASLREQIAKRDRK